MNNKDLLESEEIKFKIGDEVNFSPLGGVYCGPILRGKIKKLRKPDKIHGSDCVIVGENGTLYNGILSLITKII